MRWRRWQETTKAPTGFSQKRKRKQGGGKKEEKSVALLGASFFFPFLKKACKEEITESPAATALCDFAEPYNTQEV